jgi:hypothetical protein
VDHGRLLRAIVVLFIAGSFVALWIAWAVLLSVHSPTVPSPSTAQTEPLSLHRRGLDPIFVTLLERRISDGLLLCAFVVPGIYLVWTRFKFPGRRQRG